MTSIQDRPPAVQPPDDDGDTQIEELWTMFAEARRGGSARRIAAAEDAVFRHYLPWAQSLAEVASPREPGARHNAEYVDAAEVGLAQAILAWRRTDTGRFIDVARRLIMHRLQRLPTGINHRRLHGRVHSRPWEISPDAAIGLRHDNTAWKAPADVEVALLDRSGTIVWVNEAWKAFGEANGATPTRTGVGVSYLAVCDAADGDPYASRVARAIRRAINGVSTAAVTIRIPCRAPGHERWYDVLITPRTDDELEVIGVAVALSAAPTTIWENPCQMEAGG